MSDSAVFRSFMFFVVATTCCATYSNLAAQSQCDCSCAAYSNLQAAVEAMQESGQEPNLQQMPPELMQMSLCAGQCAMQWAQCANPNMDPEALDRTRQAQSPEALAARERALLAAERERSDGGRAESSDTSSLPKNALTADYLAGTWCSVYGGQERTQWVFDADGSYRIGMPAGGGWAMHAGGDDVENFYQRFETLVSRDADGFVTEHRHGRKNVFTRGPC